MIQTVTNNSPQQINAALFALDNSLENKTASLEKDIEALKKNIKEDSNDDGIVSGKTYDINISGNADTADYATRAEQDADGNTISSTYVKLEDLPNEVVTGVKGDAETDYRKGNVNITPANIGAATPTDITNAINALDVAEVGGGGKYIRAISETDGKISATVVTMDTAPTADSTKAVTSDGIKSAISTAEGNAKDLANAIGTLAIDHGGTGTNSQANINTNFIADLSEGASDVTDGTMFVSSYASDNGFSDTNAVNKPYKRTFLKVWNYIKDKISSVLGLTATDYGGNAASATSATYLSNEPAFKNTCFNYGQTAESFYGRDGWAHYLICNHGDGASYYNYVICLPFWGAPMYKRQMGSTSSQVGWKSFITEENIGSQSVNYATAAKRVEDENNVVQYKATSFNGYTMQDCQEKALYVEGRESSAGDSGGIAITNDAVTVFGAGDTDGVFRVINEDNVSGGPVFKVMKNGEVYTTNTIHGSLSGDISGSSTSCTGNSATATTADNADKVDGYHASAGPDALTVGVRNDGGHLYAVIFHDNWGEENINSYSSPKIMFKGNNDGYIRNTDPSNVKVGAATHDGNGNNIASTYATKDIVSINSAGLAPIVPTGPGMPRYLMVNSSGTAWEPYNNITVGHAASADNADVASYATTAYRIRTSAPSSPVVGDIWIS